MARARDNVYDLVFDPQRDAIWFSDQQDPPGTSTLDEYQIATGAVQQWTLAPAESNTLLSNIAITTDGAVWVSEAYRIVRLDPTTSQLTVLDFPLAADGALPRALDPTSADPGTWVSALAANGQSVLVARNNVPYLTRVDAAMSITGTIPLPNSLAGATALAVDDPGDIYVGQGLLGGKGVARIGRDGSATMLSGSAEHLRLINGQIFAEGGTLDGARLADPFGPVAATPAGAAAPLNSLSYPDPAGGVFRYDSSSGALTSLGPSGQPLWHVALEGAIDLVADQTGTVWAFLANSFELVAVKPAGAAVPSASTTSTALPTSLGGLPVLRVADVPKSAPGDSSPFLVGGWLGANMASCIVPAAPLGLLLPPCGYFYLTPQPPDALAKPAILPLAVQSASQTAALRSISGRAVVLRVHTHDALAASCPAGMVAACRSAIVVDAVAWTPSASTP